jgi:hypothetical protein
VTNATSDNKHVTTSCNKHYYVCVIIIIISCRLSWPNRFVVIWPNRFCFRVGGGYL